MPPWELRSWTSFLSLWYKKRVYLLIFDEKHSEIVESFKWFIIFLCHIYPLHNIKYQSNTKSGLSAKNAIVHTLSVFSSSHAKYCKWPWDIKWNYISLTLSYMDTRSKFSKVSWLGGLIDLCWIPFTNMVTQTFVVLNLV